MSAVLQIDEQDKVPRVSKKLKNNSTHEKEEANTELMTGELDKKKEPSKLKKKITRVKQLGEAEEVSTEEHDNKPKETNKPKKKITHIDQEPEEVEMTNEQQIEKVQKKTKDDRKSRKPEKEVIAEEDVGKKKKPSKHIELQRQDEKENVEPNKKLDGANASKDPPSKKSSARPKYNVEIHDCTEESVTPKSSRPSKSVKSKEGVKSEKVAIEPVIEDNIVGTLHVEKKRDKEQGKRQSKLEHPLKRPPKKEIPRVDPPVDSDEEQLPLMERILAKMQARSNGTSFGVFQ
jgi:hypothetical protein